MMFNPGMFGVTPQQMQAAREIGKHLGIEIRKCPKEGRLELTYLVINPGDTKALETAANGIDTLAEQLAYMHDTMFGIKGQIILYLPPDIITGFIKKPTEYPAACWRDESGPVPFWGSRLAARRR